MTGKIQFLTLPDRRIGYQQQPSKNPSECGIIFLGGYASDMGGTKACFLADRCAEAGWGFLRFDYSGHGVSDRKFEDCTVGMWIEDSLAVLDRLTHGRQILIGSSLGGWIALKLAMARPERVGAVIGVAAAPDFTEELVWKALSDEAKAGLLKDGTIDDGGLPITLKLIEEARSHLMLNAPIPITLPVRLLHGQKDAEVPWKHAIRTAAAIEGNDVRITLIKDGNHRLSRPEDLEALWNLTREMR